MNARTPTFAAAARSLVGTEGAGREVRGDQGAAKAIVERQLPVVRLLGLAAAAEEVEVQLARRRAHSRSYVAWRNAVVFSAGEIRLSFSILGSNVSRTLRLFVPPPTPSKPSDARGDGRVRTPAIERRARRSRARRRLGRAPIAVVRADRVDRDAVRAGARDRIALRLPGARVDEVERRARSRDRAACPRCTGSSRGRRA